MKRGVGGMRDAVDTNLLVRLFAKDHRDQWQAASDAVTGRRVYVANSVWMECEWVLRSIFGFDRPTISSLLKGLLGLTNVECEDRPTLARVVTLFDKGMDFADAMHLCTSPECENFLTFDQKLIKQTQRLDVFLRARNP